MNVSEDNKDVYVIRDDAKEGEDDFPEMDTDSDEEDDEEENSSSDDDDDEDEAKDDEKSRGETKRERSAKRVAGEGARAKEKEERRTFGVLWTRVVLRSIGWVVRV